MVLLYLLVLRYAQCVCRLPVEKHCVGNLFEAIRSRLNIIFSPRTWYILVYSSVRKRAKSQSRTNDFIVIPIYLPATACFRTSAVVGLFQTRKTITIKLHKLQSKRLSSHEHSRSPPHYPQRYYFEIFRQNGSGSTEDCRTSQTFTAPARYVSVVSKI